MMRPSLSIFILLGMLLGVMLPQHQWAAVGDEEQEKKAPPKHYNIIMIGATGDLAQKYLWTGLFDLFVNHYDKGVVNFHIYGCARTDQSEGRQILSKILLGLTCEDGDCPSMGKAFVEATQYHQLKSEEHYKQLRDKISENTLSYYGMQGAQHTYEEGRLVYMAIPPSAYVQTSRLVNKHLRPELGRPWFRVVIEKPFGHDRESAKDLAHNLKKYFADDEIYRIDHYLGKSVVKLIFPFRYVNRALYEPRWNRHHVDRVEIVMKEKIDVIGRSGFYEETGVVRDVMQNHLTELLTLVAMDLPENSGNITEIVNEKNKLLKQVTPVQPEALLIGQYESYVNEAKNEFKQDNFTSKTPTFATAMLKIHNNRWKDVPFLLVSGKKLDDKASYVRIVFKQTEFGLSKDAHQRTNAGQIVFMIGSSDLNKPPMILMSKTFKKPKPHRSWRLEEMKPSLDIFGEHLSDMYQIMPEIEVDAYTSLIEAVFNAERHLFTNTESLLHAWNIWTPALNAIGDEELRIYRGKNENQEQLQFTIKGQTLAYTHHEEIVRFDAQLNAVPTMTQLPATFLEDQLVAGQTDDIITALATNIHKMAVTAIHDRGHFNLAFSGGKSPPKLLQKLASIDLFPWHQTHLWMVDERCVYPDDVELNFNMMEENLLRHIDIPYHNIHPMPIMFLSDQPCDTNDTGDAFYEAALNRQLVNGTMDFIVLGLGTDGHTASLFPNQASLEPTDKWVMYAESGIGHLIRKRVTMTLPFINNAHQIAVLVTGKSKHNILHLLVGEESDSSYPILSVIPKHGTKTWYIDNDAYFG